MGTNAISTNKLGKSNQSIKQINKEVVTAKGQSLSRYHDFEIEDKRLGFGTDSNSLTDVIEAARNRQGKGKQFIPLFVKQKIETIFENHPIQYRLLGLYFAANFTIDEIADIEDMDRSNVRKSLSRGKARLKKYLQDYEYDSIRWLVRDPKPVKSDVKRMEWKGYIDTYTCQGREPFSYHA